MPELPVKIMMNVGNPDRAFSFSQLPNDGVGLARLEFIINNMIGIHPKALMAADKMDAEVQQVIREKPLLMATRLSFISAVLLKVYRPLLQRFIRPK